MKLYQHQTDGLKATEGMNHVAYYWDMGLGKTFAGSEKMAQLGADVNLIVCQKSKIADWLDHFATNYDHEYISYDLTVHGQIEAYMTKCVQQHPQKIVGIINYDLIWRRKELLKLTDFTLMLDESSLIQNETAKRSRFILKLQPKNVILLSGTPTGGKYERLWSQMHLLGWLISKKTYWNQYVNVEYLDTAGRSIPIVTGYKNVDRLKRKMAEHGCQFLKTEEVFDLPEQMIIKHNVPVTKEYRTFKKDKIVAIGETELVGDTTLTRMLYERMLCGHYNEAKLKAFTDLVESTEDRLVVFYNFTAELDALMQIAVTHERQFGVVNGQHKNPEMINPDGAILFVQYQAGAMGLNLQKANKIIYFTLPLSSELFEQSKKRIHRIGQHKPCFYYLLICKNSIEERILKTLEQRKDYTEKLFAKDDEI